LAPQAHAVTQATFAAHGVVPRFDFNTPGAALVSAGLVALFHMAFPTVLLVLVGRRSASRDFLPAS